MLIISIVSINKPFPISNRGNSHPLICPAYLHIIAIEVLREIAMDRWAGGNDAEESGVGRQIATHLVGSAAELRHWDAQEFAQSGARLPW